MKHNRTYFDDMSDLYIDKVMISESKEGDNKGTVKSDVKPGKGFDGSEKKDKSSGTNSPVMSEVDTGTDKKEKCDKPVKKEKELKESNKTAKPKSFNAMYNTLLLGEDSFEQDESPVEKDDVGEYSDEMDDFPPEGDDGVDDEVEVTSQLRMVIDTLSDIAEKLGAFDDEEEIDVDVDGIEDDPSEEPIIPESLQAKLTKLKDGVKVLQNKNNKVKSNFNADGSKAKNVGPGKGKCDGKIQNQSKSAFSPTMSQKAPGSGTSNKAGATLF